MRTTILSLVILLCAGCATGVSPIQAVSQSSSLEGNGVIGAFTVGPVPLTYPVKFSGSGTLTLQYPAQPHVLIDGDLVVEPFIQFASQTDATIASGRMAIRRGGSPVALQPPGTLKEIAP